MLDAMGHVDALGHAHILMSFLFFYSKMGEKLLPSHVKISFKKCV
jgi:hypothetical protein